MQLGAREKNSIRVSIILTIIFIIVFILLLIMDAYPKYLGFENKKSELKIALNDIEEINTKGLKYGDFKKLQTIIKTEYLRNIINNMDIIFYKKNFINNKGGKYEKFLKDKKRLFYDNDVLLSLSEKKLANLDNDIEQKVRADKKREEKIASLLPSYNPNLNGYDENLLTDFKFINYIESILRTFELNMDSPIGIGNIIKYKSTIDSNKKSKSTIGNSNIFYIPISFDLSGKKEKIINFIHYIGNVGNIKIKDGNFEIINDNFLFDKKKIILHGDFNKLFGNGGKYNKIYKKGDIYYNIVNDYNIYNHQIIDIKSIILKKYPISYYLEGDREKNEKVTDFIKRVQKNEIYSIKISLRFYIKGVPRYKIIEYVKHYISKYNKIKSNIAQKLSILSKNKNQQENGNEIRLKTQFGKANNYLNSLSDSIKKMSIELKNGKSIETLYETTIEQNKILNNFIKVLGLDEEKYTDLELGSNKKGKK